MPGIVSQDKRSSLLGLCNFFQEKKGKLKRKAKDSNAVLQDVAAEAEERNMYTSPHHGDPKKVHNAITLRRLLQSVIREKATTSTTPSELVLTLCTDGPRAAFKPSFLKDVGFQSTSQSSFNTRKPDITLSSKSPHSQAETTNVDVTRKRPLGLTADQEENDSTSHATKQAKTVASSLITIPDSPSSERSVSPPQRTNDTSKRSNKPRKDAAAAVVLEEQSTQETLNTALSIIATSGPGVEQTLAIQVFQKETASTSETEEAAHPNGILQTRDPSSKHYNKSTYESRLYSITMGGGQIRNAASELRFGTEQVLLELLENLGLETTEPTRFQTDPSPGLARLYSAVFGRPNWKPCAAQLFKEGISVRFFGQALIETFLHTEVIVARQPWHPESRLEAMCASGIPYDGSDPQRIPSDTRAWVKHFVYSELHDPRFRESILHKEAERLRDTAMLLISEHYMHHRSTNKSRRSASESWEDSLFDTILRALELKTKLDTGTTEYEFVRPAFGAALDRDLCFSTNRGNQPKGTVDSVLATGFPAVKVKVMDGSFMVFHKAAAVSRLAVPEKL